MEVKTFEPLFTANSMFVLQEKGIDMNARSLKCTLGGALILGMLAAAPAQAGSGLIKITHATPSYGGGFQYVTPIAANAQPAVNPTKAAEVQVAVMAIAPTQPTVRRAVFIHR